MNSISKTDKYNAVLGGTVDIEENATILTKNGLLTNYQEFQKPHPETNIVGRSIKFLFSLLKNRQTPEKENTAQGYRQKQVDIRDFSFNLVTTNNRGEVINTSQGYARSFLEDLGNGVELEMVEIPAGKFLMGSNKQGCDWEFPQHAVKLPTFFMSKYPITQEQYTAIAGLNPSRFKGDQLPVENVSWNNAVSFCEVLRVT